MKNTMTMIELRRVDRSTAQSCQQDFYRAALVGVSRAGTTRLIISYPSDSRLSISVAVPISTFASRTPNSGIGAGRGWSHRTGVKMQDTYAPPSFAMAKAAKDKRRKNKK